MTGLVPGMPYTFQVAVRTTVGVTETWSDYSPPSASPVFCTPTKPRTPAAPVDGEGGEVLRGILARAALLERGVEEGGGVVGEREHQVVPRVQRVLHGLADELL